VDTTTIIVITIVVDSVTILIKASLLVAGEAILIGTHNVERGTAGTAFVTLFIGIFYVVNCRHGKTREIGDAVASNLAKVDVECHKASKQIRLEH